MSEKRFQFNSTWIALGILVAAYIYSAVNFIFVIQPRAGSSEDEDEKGGRTVVRVTHWQLEPGFREAMQWAIDKYNALPHVVDARVEIVQAPVPERVYNQFMNVHLISGTAPDIAVLGMSQLIVGNALAKFYQPLGNYITKPNPYNAPEYQLEDLPEELGEFLTEAPWRDTYFDGMQGGYESSLSDYYGVPVATWGGVRLFYNMDLLGKTKAFARAAAERERQPEWLRKLWRTAENPEGFIVEEDGVRWLNNENLPETLGQLMLYCYALQAYARSIDDDVLVPIAGSSYGPNNLAEFYQSLFLTNFWKELILTPGTSLTEVDTLQGYTGGKWDFDSPAMKESFEFLRMMSEFYPRGFLGLDREQAQRRFVLGQAGIIVSGGWDASSILESVKKRDRPEDCFEVVIAPYPLPAEDERWSDLLTMRRSEANAVGAVPFAITRNTRHFDWCLDFLQFLSSHRINEEFSHRSGWLPVIVGAEPPERVAAFMPIVEGWPHGTNIDFKQNNMPGNLRNAWSAQSKLFMAGDTSYEEMVERLDKALRDPNFGIRRAWAVRATRERDYSRAADRSLSVERMFAVFENDKDAADRERALFHTSVATDEAFNIRSLWAKENPDEPFPEF